MSLRSQIEHLLRRCKCAVAALCVAALPLPASGKLWVQAQRDTDTASAVWAYISHEDGAGAVRELTAGVAKNFPAVLLLAGARFEDGVCPKANRSKAR